MASFRAQLIVAIWSLFISISSADVGPFFLFDSHEVEYNTSALGVVSQKELHKIIKKECADQVCIVFAAESLCVEDLQESSESDTKCFEHVSESSQTFSIENATDPYGTVKKMYGRNGAVEVRSNYITQIGRELAKKELRMLIVSLPNQDENQTLCDYLSVNDRIMKQVMDQYGTDGKRYALCGRRSGARCRKSTTIDCSTAYTYIPPFPNGTANEQLNSELNNFVNICPQRQREDVYWQPYTIHMPTLCKNDKMFLYFTSLNVTRKDDSKQFTICATELRVSLIEDGLLRAQLIGDIIDTQTQAELDEKFEMELNVHMTEGARWFLSGAQIDKAFVWNKYIGASEGFSYHCSPNIIFRAENRDSKWARVDMYGLQIHPQFKLQQDPLAKFASAHDCIGFGSVDTWSISAAILLLLIFGCSLISMLDVRTMDRFEDPNGRGIVIKEIK